MIAMVASTPTSLRRRVGRVSGGADRPGAPDAAVTEATGATIESHDPES